MSCCSNTVSILCDYDLCNGDITTAITATVAGNYRIEVMPFNNVQTINFNASQAIKLPKVLFNEQAAHIIKIYTPDGLLLNDTCYKITTKIFNKCLISKQNTP